MLPGNRVFIHQCLSGRCTALQRTKFCLLRCVLPAAPAPAYHPHRSLHHLTLTVRHASSASSAAHSGQPAAAPGGCDGDAEHAPHVPVLLQQILAAFQPVTIRTYVDGTLGAGGHACAILRAHPEVQTLIGFDVDPAAHSVAGPRLQAAARPETRIHLIRANYCDVKHHLSSLPPGEIHAGDATRDEPHSLYGKVDAILMDLGVSSMQIDTPERGFSFLRDGRIDMRMDPSAALSAEEIINTWSEAELGRVIRDWGEEKLWRQVARRIVAARAGRPITTTQQLVAAIGATQLPRRGGEQGKGIHPATRTFQALRIAVNDELGRLQQAIPDAIGALASGGRLAVISFHSLEDRVVKRAFARACGKVTPEEEHLLYGPDKFQALDAFAARAVAAPVTRKPLVACPEETAANPRSRSAKLRVIQRL